MDLATELSSCISPERILTKAIERIAYASDASFYRLIPQAIVQPKSTNEISDLFRFSQAHKRPITFRSGGTSLAGQAVTDSILVDCSKHWLDYEIINNGSQVRVQTGVVGSFINNALKRFGRRIGPDPASIDAAQIGGIVANNASGMCSGVLENTYKTMASIKFTLPNGDTIDTSLPNASQTFKESAPQIYQGLKDLRNRLTANVPLSQRITEKYHMKNTTGYSLNAFVDFSDPLDIFTHLLIGSEGTLAFISEVVLNTLPIFPYRHTGLLYFKDVETAASAITPLRDSGARALELMDRAGLRSVENHHGAPDILKHLPDSAAAILVEYQCPDQEQLGDAQRHAITVCKSISLLHDPEFTRDPSQQDALWKIRKGLFTTTGSVRKPGTTVIIEDVAYPLPVLAKATIDLQAMFRAYDFPEAVIFGHAKDGNLHFVITPSFSDQQTVDRYDRFMREVVDMTVNKYDGALKAEHGTGRNIAPFVVHEWGEEAYSIMKDLKSLVDPSGMLNPGVIINDNPNAHIESLKPLPIVEAEIDKCIECGYCEPTCPSHRLTLSPRQRIVVRREITRLEISEPKSAFLAQLKKEYVYFGTETCAADGLCASACPVGINTGVFVKHLREHDNSTTANKIAETISNSFGAVENVLGIAMRIAHTAEKVIGANGIVTITKGAEKLSGTTLPKWNAFVPRSTPLTHQTTRQAGAQAVYFPSCITRIMGVPPGSQTRMSLIDLMITLAERANHPVWIPNNVAGNCCGMPFSSKGFMETYRHNLHRTLNKFWNWSEEGRLPVVIDTSSCAYTLRGCENDLTEEDLLKWRQLKILDPNEFVFDYLVPKMSIRKQPISVALHPNCSARKLGTADRLVKIANLCAETATVPLNLGCCGFAGDRGLLFPELTLSATELEAKEINKHSYAGYYSTNPTCEMGISMGTGKVYESVLYLLELATRS